MLWKGNNQQLKSHKLSCLLLNCLRCFSDLKSIVERMKKFTLRSYKRPSQHINDLILIHVHVYNSKFKTTIEILKHGFYIIIYIIHVEANDNNNNIPGSIL